MSQSHETWGKDGKQLAQEVPQLEIEPMTR